MEDWGKKFWRKFGNGIPRLRKVIWKIWEWVSGPPSPPALPALPPLPACVTHTHTRGGITRECLLSDARAVCVAQALAVCLVWCLSVCARVNDPSVSNINDQWVSKKSPEGGPIIFRVLQCVCAAVSYVFLCVVSYCLMTHWLRVSLISRAFQRVYCRCWHQAQHTHAGCLIHYIQSTHRLRVFLFLSRAIMYLE